MQENLQTIFQTIIQSVAQNWDLRKFEEAKEAFDNVVEIDYTSLGAPQVTYDEIDKLCQNWKIVLSGFDITTHTVQVQSYEQIGEIYYVTSKVDAYHQLNGIAEGTEWKIKGIYTHQFKKINDQWKIVGMKLNVEEQSGNLKLIMEATKKTMS